MIFSQSNTESHCFPFIFIAIDSGSRLLKVCYNFRLNYPFLIFMFVQNEWKTHFALNFQQKKPKIPSKQHQHYCRPVTTAATFCRRLPHLHHNYHNQLHIYSKCRSKYVQFGHCSNNGTLRRWDTGNIS